MQLIALPTAQLPPTCVITGSIPSSQRAGRQERMFFCSRKKYEGAQSKTGVENQRQLDKYPQQVDTVGGTEVPHEKEHMHCLMLQFYYVEWATIKLA